jgi:hypothetical protein
MRRSVLARREIDARGEDSGRSGATVSSLSLRYAHRLNSAVLNATGRSAQGGMVMERHVRRVVFACFAIRAEPVASLRDRLHRPGPSTRRSHMHGVRCRPCPGSAAHSMEAILTLPMTATRLCRLSHQSGLSRSCDRYFPRFTSLLLCPGCACDVDWEIRRRRGTGPTSSTPYRSNPARAVLNGTGSLGYRPQRSIP